MSGNLKTIVFVGNFMLRGSVLWDDYQRFFYSIEYIHITTGKSHVSKITDSGIILIVIKIMYIHLCFFDVITYFLCRVFLLFHYFLFICLAYIFIFRSQFCVALNRDFSREQLPCFVEKKNIIYVHFIISILNGIYLVRSIWFDL